MLPLIAAPDGRENYATSGIEGKTGDASERNSTQNFLAIHGNLETGGKGRRSFDMDGNHPDDWRSLFWKILFYSDRAFRVAGVPAGSAG